MKTTLKFDYSANRGKSVSVTGNKGWYKYVMIDKCNSDWVYDKIPYQATFL